MNIDNFNGINRGERYQNAMIHILSEINKKLDLLVEQNVSRETICPNDVSRETLPVKRKAKNKSKEG